MSTTPDHGVQAPEDEPKADRHGRVLRRPLSGRMVAGVAAGLARYAGIDVTIVRIGFAVLTIVGFTGLPFFGSAPFYLLGVPLYLACWLFIPEEGSDQAIAAAMLRKIQSRSH
jgi:phage shock protein PspC (stress-responsive transcriptional regulator)